MSKISIAVVFGVLTGIFLYTGYTVGGFAATMCGLWAGIALCVANDIIRDS